MGERRPSLNAGDRGYAQNSESAHYETQGEAVIVAAERELVRPKTASSGQDCVTDSGVQERERVKPRPSFREPTGNSPLLKTIGDLYIANEVLKTEYQELKEKEEQRKERNRQSAKQWKANNRKEYNEYQKNIMKERREKAKQAH